MGAIRIQNICNYVNFDSRRPTLQEPPGGGWGQLGSEICHICLGILFQLYPTPVADVVGNSGQLLVAHL